MPASPKKHVVVYFSHSDTTWPVSARVLALEGEEMVIRPEEYYIDQRYLLSGIMTVRDVIRLNTPEIEKKTRNRAAEYWFSAEIRVKYTIRDRRGQHVAIVSYDTIPDDAGKKRKLSRNI